MLGPSLHRSMNGLPEGAASSGFVSKSHGTIKVLNPLFGIEEDIPVTPTKSLRLGSLLQGANAKQGGSSSSQLPRPPAPAPTPSTSLNGTPFPWEVAPALGGGGGALPGRLSSSGAAQGSDWAGLPDHLLERIFGFLRDASGNWPNRQVCARGAPLQVEHSNAHHRVPPPPAVRWRAAFIERGLCPAA